MARCGSCGARLEPLAGDCEEFRRIPEAPYTDPVISVVVLLALLEHLLAAFDDFVGGDWLALSKSVEGRVSEVIEQQQHGVIDGWEHRSEASDSG